ncbi:translation initiation factor IF-2-like [Perognathus longimembris pacificus]|uniref:translation initiation factor IF-2-like n=1 Tax=Perognathus longimembris pacificus TaxID=214514 RepID=UPI002019F20E|nr:translation initiation factor IF-2-like [Perognathus longimembris pacificus]
MAASAPAMKTLSLERPRLASAALGAPPPDLRSRRPSAAVRRLSGGRASARASIAPARTRAPPPGGVAPASPAAAISEPRLPEPGVPRRARRPARPTPWPRRRRVRGAPGPGFPGRCGAPPPTPAPHFGGRVRGEQGRSCPERPRRRTGEGVHAVVGGADRAESGHPGRGRRSRGDPPTSPARGSLNPRRNPRRELSCTLAYIPIKIPVGENSKSLPAGPKRAPSGRPPGLPTRHATPRAPTRTAADEPRRRGHSEYTNQNKGRKHVAAPWSPG